MKHEQLEKRIAELHEKMFALQKEIEGVESELVKMKDAEEWPQDGDKYHYVSWCGNIEGTEYDCNTDRCAKLIGNVFRSEEAAEFAVERLKVLAEMRKFAFEPDWNDAEQQKYMFQYGIGEGISIEFEDQYCDFYGPWFASFSDAQKCLDAIGEERLKKYYFGVKDVG